MSQQTQGANIIGNKNSSQVLSRDSSKYFSIISLDSHSPGRWSVLLSFPLYSWANGTKSTLYSLPNTYHSDGAERGHQSRLCCPLLCTASCWAASPLSFPLANCLPALCLARRPKFLVFLIESCSPLLGFCPAIRSNMLTPPCLLSSQELTHILPIWSQ